MTASSLPRHIPRAPAAALGFDNGDPHKPSGAPISIPWGADLTPEDYRDLGTRWMTPELADQSYLRRVDSQTARQMFSRRTGELAGRIIPNVAPWEPDHVREYRLRLDHPPIEYRIDGSTRETQKYIGPAGRPNLLYFPVGVTPELLADTSIPVVIVEGEFKAMAVWRLANHDASAPRFLPVSVAGVDSYRGTIGKVTGPDGERRDVKGVLPDVERIAWKGRRAIIAYDADAEQNPKVRGARYRLTATLIERGATVGVLEWPIEEGKGIDDRLANVGPDRVLADIAAVQFGDWRMRLIRNDAGKLIACTENAALFLENSPEWSGVLGHNEFTGGFTIARQPPAPITAAVGDEIEDHFDTEVTRWLERKGIMVKPDVVRRIVDTHARQNSYHPVRNYLESLVWDRQPRIATWLIDHCGVRSSDSEPNWYAMAIGERMLISAVARIFEPGAKVDAMLVLEGPQGYGKSTAARILAGDEYFTDQLSDMGSKDASMQLRGVWIVELGELDALNRAEMSRVKMFLTQQQERFRLPYGKRIVHAPRQCVFVGTTNSETWNRDETGGRRFWPVKVGRIDLGGLKRDRDQLWAEAVHQYRAGAKWWLEEPELVKDAAHEQSDRYEGHPWDALIAKWVPSPKPKLGYDHQPVAPFDSDASSVSISDVLNHAIGKRQDQWTQADKNTVARALRSLNWERYRDRTRGMEWRYRPE